MLGSEGRHTLTVEPARRCPRAFADTLKDHKWLVLDLLRLPFVMVFSEVLGETIFFCENEATKAALVAAGAEPACIYTREELRLLLQQHRRNRITAAELLRINGIRRVFSARVVE
jgi:hypothetical protein